MIIQIGQKSGVAEREGVQNHWILPDNRELSGTSVAFIKKRKEASFAVFALESSFWYNYYVGKPHESSCLKTTTPESMKARPVRGF
jgi:hypothetical protein